MRAFRTQYNIPKSWLLDGFSRTKLTELMYLGTDIYERIRFGGQNVKVQGHGEIKYILRA